MNLLINDPPTELSVDGVFYPIDPDYRNCLVIIQAFEDEELSSGEKVAVMLDRLYLTQPEDRAGAAHAAVDFLNCGDALKTADTGRVYSLAGDSRWIRSAFEKSYHIRLSETGMHWWEFCYKFLDLDDDSFFMKLMGMRARLNKGGKASTKEDRQFRAQNPELFDVCGTGQSVDAAFALEQELTLRQQRRRELSGG